MSFFAWENSWTNLNTLKWKFADVIQFLVLGKMPSAWHFPPHIVFLCTDILACELSLESVVHKRDTWLMSLNRIHASFKKILEIT